MKDLAQVIDGGTAHHYGLTLTKRILQFLTAILQLSPQSAIALSHNTGMATLRLGKNASKI